MLLRSRTIRNVADLYNASTDNSTDTGNFPYDSPTSLPFTNTTTTDTPNNNNNNNNNNSNQSTAPTTISTVLGFVFLSLICLSMRSTRSPEAQRRLRRYKKRKGKKERPDLRNIRIEQSLRVQRVVRVDESGQVQLQDVLVVNDDDISNSSSAIEEGGAAKGNESRSVASNNKDNDNYYDDDDDDLVACCGICLEPYRVNDIVAWSSSTSEDCLHVFHKDCIQPWLENPKHDDCPQCRTIILQPLSQDNISIDSDDSIDEEHQRNNNIVATTSNDSEDGDDEDDIDSDHNINTNNNSVVYYIMHGLISRANHVKFSLIGQTISIDSDDSDIDDGLYRTDHHQQQYTAASDIENGYELEPTTTAAIAFRRAKSFSERMFTNRFSFTSSSSNRQQQQQQEFKSLSMVDDHNSNSNSNSNNINMVGERRRASTKLILPTDHELSILQQPHDLRRVVSAGPCTPLDCRSIRMEQQQLLLQQQKKQEGEENEDGEITEQKDKANTPLELMLVPLRRGSSSVLRKRLFSQGTISDCDDDCDDEPQIIITDNTNNSSDHNFESSEATDEDDIIIHKKL